MVRNNGNGLQSKLLQAIDTIVAENRSVDTNTNSTKNRPNSLRRDGTEKAANGTFYFNCGEIFRWEFFSSSDERRPRVIRWPRQLHKQLNKLIKRFPQREEHEP